jgi:hypothetical protein
MEPRQPVPVTPAEHEVNQHISHYYLPHNERANLTGIISSEWEEVITMSLQYYPKINQQHYQLCNLGVTFMKIIILHYWYLKGNQHLRLILG